MKRHGGRAPAILRAVSNQRAVAYLEAKLFVEKRCEASGDHVEAELSNLGFRAQVRASESRRKSSKG